jgi:branched-subunit amino acid aminotransferase/4-amino-4-deoxychorismate lyase
MSTAQFTALASLDGAISEAAETVIPITDPGLIRGDGAFEVIRVVDGEPFKLDEHFDRLERSGRNLRLNVDREAVSSELWRLLAEAYGQGHPRDHAIRVMLTRGGRRIVMTEPMHPLPPVSRLATITYSPTLVLDGIKSLSYAANMLMARLAQERGFDDALLVTPGGTVLEATTSSIFWIRDGVLATPPLEDHILASITRQLVFDVVAATGVAGGSVIERSVDLEDLLAADEVFLASTMRDVQPVATIDETLFTTPGPLSAVVAQAVAAHVSEWRAGRAAGSARVG